MKKTLLVITAITLLLAGCYKKDIRNLRDDLNELKAELARYEVLLNAVNSRLHITGYEEVNGKFVIRLSDGSALTTGNSPIILTKGNNNNWLIDGADSGVPAENSTPSVTIGSNNNWEINGKSTNIKAVISANTSGIIAIVKLDDYLTFLFGNGQNIQLKTLAPQVTVNAPEGGFTFDKLQWIKISGEVTHNENASYSWTLGADTIGTNPDLLHVFAIPGSYVIKFSATNAIGTGSQDIVVKINDKNYVNNVTRVFDFLPAPGQFTNKLPAWVAGETTEDIIKKAETSLTNNTMISLGGFGGYVTMGFDHVIANQPGKASFVVNGNALAEWSEPGVIEVSYDANGNGLPDDDWYEIAGSEYNHPKTVKNYEITYYRPDPEKKPTPGGGFNVDNTYIKWTDNQGKEGYVSKNSFHSQSYYPEWKGESITYKGTKLTEDNVVDRSGTGSYWVSMPYEFGYADNWGNANEKAKIKIDWAVDKNGNKVHLKGINFIRVYTAVRAEGGWLGEVSTEVTGVRDLNL